MNRIFTLAVILLSPVLIYAQAGYTAASKEQASKISTNTLAVVLKKNYGENADQLLRAAIEKEWKISKEIKFIDAAEAMQLKETKAEGYSILEIDNLTSASAHMKYTQYRDVTVLAISNTTQPNQKIAITAFPVLDLSEGAMTYMILNLQNQITDCSTKGIASFGAFKDEIQKRTGLLKNKTLLLIDPLMDKALKRAIEKDGLSRYYEYKYEVVSIEKANTIIQEKNQNYAYIWVVTDTGHLGGHEALNYYVIDAADGRPLYLTGMGAIGAGYFNPAHLALINKKIKKAD